MTVTMSRSRRVLPTTGPYRCGKCREFTGSYEEVRGHCSVAHPNMCWNIEAVLSDVEITETTTAVPAAIGPSLHTGEDRGVGTSDHPSEGTGPASSSELPSDDNREMWQHEKPKKRPSRARASIPLPAPSPLVQSAKPTPEERRRAKRLIDQARQASEKGAAS